MDQALEYAVKSGSGIFAVLFIVLLGWVLRTNNERERRFIGVVEKQAGALSNFKSMSEDIRELRDWMLRLAGGNKP